MYGVDGQYFVCEFLTILASSRRRNENTENNTLTGELPTELGLMYNLRVLSLGTFALIDPYF
jgi:hypothetical protein